MLAGAAFAAWWAISQVSDPPADPVISAGPVTYTVESGEIGRALDFNGFAQWNTKIELGGFAPGVVTEVWSGNGSVVDAGDLVLSVNLDPSVVAEGAVPAFRPLASGTEGADVIQLQQFLVQAGWYTGTVDGRFGATTLRAVRAWQESAGMVNDGVVDLGELIFLDELPTRIRMLVTVGERIQGAETLVIAVLADEPQFWIPIAAQQQQLIPSQARLDLQLPNGSLVPAVITSAVETETGIDLLLGGVDRPLCDVGCDDLLVTGRSPIDVIVEVVPVTTGAVVPLSAIEVQPSGIATVTLGSGEVQSVEIIAEDRGLAVVEGVASGTKILLLSPDG